MMKLTPGVVFVGLVFAASPGGAQTEDFSGMSVTGAPRVIVTDRSGQETPGRLISWTPTSIVLDTNGTKRTYSPGEAVRIDLRSDSLKNGIIIGAAFGALGGLIAECSDPMDPARRDGTIQAGASCPGTRVALTVASIGIWALIGAGIDALIPGRSPLWRSGAPAKSARGPTFNISPRERRASIDWRFQIPKP